MAYNSSGYNTFASNQNGVLESGGTTATTSLNTTESGIANELGTTVTNSTFDATDISLSTEAGTTVATATIDLDTLSNYNGTTYNASSYNGEGGEIALSFESGETNSNTVLNATEASISLESGITQSQGVVRLPTDTAYNTDSYNRGVYNTESGGEIAFAFEDGTTEAVGDFGAIEQHIEFIFRTHTRDVDLSFTLQREFLFNEDKTMTEIEEIDDTITDETRKLEFTAKEDGSKKDISGATIKWSLADNNGVVLDESDSEVDITIVDAGDGRFDVDVDTIDADAGVYRQRVEVTDGKGRVTRSTGVYRLRPF